MAIVMMIIMSTCATVQNRLYAKFLSKLQISDAGIKNEVLHADCVIPLMISDSNNDGMLLYSEFLMFAREVELKSDNRSEQPHRTLNTKKMKLMFNELISMCEKKIGDKGKCMEETSGVKALWVPQSMAGESGNKITSPLSKEESSFISIVCVNTKRMMKSERNRKGRRLLSSSSLYNTNISSHKHENKKMRYLQDDWNYSCGKGKGKGKGKKCSPPPTPRPSPVPSPNPSNSPSAMPTITTSPSSRPSFRPTLTSSPSKRPSSSPSSKPSAFPSDQPTLSTSPTSSPSSKPSAFPSDQPTLSTSPTSSPSSKPSAFPSDPPTRSTSPTSSPSSKPSAFPSDPPTRSTSPTSSPSMVPSSAPSEDPPPPPPLYLVGLIFLAINMRVCYACFKRNKEQNRLGYAKIDFPLPVLPSDDDSGSSNDSEWVEQEDF
jgi:hypothetical protein